MNNKDFEALVKDTFAECERIMSGKGHEYAGSEDRLANFKRGAVLTGATSLQVALIYLSKHYESIAAYVKKDAAGQAQSLSEPIGGRLDDLINYCLLMKGLIHEAEHVEVTTKVDPHIIETFGPLEKRFVIRAFGPLDKDA